MNKEKVFYLIGAGHFAKERFSPKDDDIIITADGGYDYIVDSNYKVNYFVGDCDSTQKKIDRNIKQIIYPKRKDETDMTLALQLSLELKAKNIKIFGAYGDRIDHFYANLQTMHYYAIIGLNLELVEDNFSIFTLHNSSLHFNSTTKNKIISIFSLSKISKDVTILGLDYELKDGILYYNVPTGVSNKTIGKPYTISVKDGTLAIISYDIN